VNTVALGWNCIIRGRWRDANIVKGYLSAVNAPPKTEQEAKDRLTILVE